MSLRSSPSFSPSKIASRLSGLALTAQLGCTTAELPSDQQHCQEQVSTRVSSDMQQALAMIRGRIMDSQAQPFTDTLKLIPPSGNYYLGIVNGLRANNTFTECHESNGGVLCQTGTITGSHPGSVSNYTQITLSNNGVALETPAAIQFETISTDPHRICAATDGKEWGSSSCDNAQKVCEQAISDVSADIQAVFYQFSDRSKP